MSIERTERPEQNDLASAPPIEPVYPGAGDDAAGDEQARFDLSAVQSIEPVHRGADDVTGDEQARIDLSAVQSIEPAHRGAEDTPPSPAEFRAMTEAMRELGPPDTPAPPLRETAEPGDAPPPADAPPTDPVIAEARAEGQEGWRAAAVGKLHTAWDTTKTAVEAVEVGEKVYDFAANHLPAVLDAAGQVVHTVFK